MKDRKNKHLTLEDRNTIQQCLDHGMTFKAIAVFSSVPILTSADFPL